jgi:hypothetical protein
VNGERTREMCGRIDHGDLVYDVVGAHDPIGPDEWCEVP